MQRIFKNYHTFFVLTLSITAGIIAGFADITALQTIGLTIADIFIGLFKCVSAPMIALSIVVTLSSLGAEARTSQLLRRTLLYTISTTLIAATVSCLLYVMIQPSNVNVALTTAPVLPMQSMGYAAYLTSLLPSNLFTPFLQNQMMSVLLISVVIGVAIRQISDETAKQHVVYFFKGMHGLFLIMIKWLVAILPIGLFGFMTTIIMHMRQGVHIGGMGAYLTVIVLANLIQGFIVLPLWLKSRGIPPYVMMKKMMPALSVAFFSKSSAGTLPITMDTVEKRLGVQPQVSRFVLPLCTSFNMNGCAAFIFTTVIFVMQNNGVMITPLLMIGWMMIATLAAVGNAGVPMGCFFLSASLLSTMNIPIILMGIILPFYNLIDMLETALNVWSDACVTAVVAEAQAVGEGVLDLI